MELSYETLFWLFVGLGLIIALGIYMITRSIGLLITSDTFKERLIKLKDNETLKAILLLIGFAMAGDASATSVAVESAGESVLGTIDSTALWAMLAIDAMLLLVLLYMRSHFISLMRMAFPEVLEKRKVVRKKKVRSKLTDIVPIAEESSILLDHDYDGIQELDNNLPPWWKYGFYLTIVVAFLYMGHYHLLKTGDLQTAEYRNEIREADRAVQAYLVSAALNVDENSVVVLTETADINAGAKLFTQYCVVCHAADGGGIVGPNLTDDYWLYGPDIKSLFTTIKYGAKNGMKSWKDELNPVQMQQVASFIRTLHGITPIKAKAPDGELMPFDDDSDVESGDESNPEAAADSLIALQ